MRAGSAGMPSLMRYWIGAVPCHRSSAKPGVPSSLRLKARSTFSPASPKLKQAGLRLGIVTNTFDATATKLEWFRRVGIDTIWDSFATSCELKLMKPRPGIYLAALAPLDLYPSQAAFVGHAQEE